MSNKINMKTVDGLEEGLANKADKNIPVADIPATAERSRLQTIRFTTAQ